MQVHCAELSRTPIWALTGLEAQFVTTLLAAKSGEMAHEGPGWGWVMALALSSTTIKPPLLSSVFAVASLVELLLESLRSLIFILIPR